MSESVLSLANKLLPGLSVDCASYGTLRKVETTGRLLAATVPLCKAGWRVPYPAGGATVPAIMAANAQRIFVIDRIDAARGRPTASMHSVSDVRAECSRIGWQTSVSLRSHALLSELFGYDLNWEFDVRGNGVQGDRSAGACLARACNRDGDLTLSAVPLLRFLARSIAVHRNGTLSYGDALLSRGYRAFVSKVSVREAIETLAREKGWLRTFIDACGFEEPDQDEVFLLFRAGRWILTNRRLYLTDARRSLVSVRFEDIRGYRIQRLRKNLEIRLRSGQPVTRPVADGDYLSEAEFDRVLDLAHRADFHAARAADRCTPAQAV